MYKKTSPFPQHPSNNRPQEAQETQKSRCYATISQNQCEPHPFEGWEKRPGGARASSRGWSEAEPPDLSPDFSRPGWGGGKYEKINGMRWDVVNNIRAISTLRPSGAQKKRFFPGGSASLHPRLLTGTPAGYFDWVAALLRKVPCVSCGKESGSLRPCASARFLFFQSLPFGLGDGFRRRRILSYCGYSGLFPRVETHDCSRGIPSEAFTSGTFGYTD